MLWCRGVVVLTTTQLHSTKSDLSICIGSIPACGVLEIWDGEDPGQLAWLQIRLNVFVGQPYHENNLSSPPSWGTLQNNSKQNGSSCCIVLKQKKLRNANIEKPQDKQVCHLVIG